MLPGLGCASWTARTPPLAWSLHVTGEGSEQEVISTRRLTLAKQTGPKLTAASMHNASRACCMCGGLVLHLYLYGPHQGNLPLPVG